MTRPAASRSATTATCVITRTCAPRTAPPAASTAAPTPRSGERWLEDEWQPDASGGSLLAALHERFGGLANLAVLAADGTAHHYAGNDENPVFAFRLGRIGLASTGIYSLDRSLFKFVAPGATERRMVRLRTGSHSGLTGVIRRQLSAPTEEVTCTSRARPGGPPPTGDRLRTSPTRLSA